MTVVLPYQQNEVSSNPQTILNLLHPILKLYLKYLNKKLPDFFLYGNRKVQIIIGGQTMLITMATGMDR